MMSGVNLDYLTVPRPWRKSYTIRGKETKETPVPFSFRFTSYTDVVNSIEEMFASLQARSEQGAALLRGNLTRTLNGETRRGAVDLRDKRSRWLLLDVDGVRCVDNAEALLFGELGLPKVRYIEHLSSSTGFKPGYRAHIFIMLDEAVRLDQLKGWIWAAQLANPALAEEMRLDPSGCVLLPVLDPAACVPSQLFTIADPVIVPKTKDPAPDRWRLSKEGSPVLAVNDFRTPPSPVLDENKVSILAVKRSELGIKGIKGDVGQPYLDNQGAQWTPVHNPIAAEATHVEESGDFVRIDVNGTYTGTHTDSPYWHPKNRPDKIYCFRGMLEYKTKELLPAYYASLMVERADMAREEAHDRQRRVEDGESLICVFMDEATEQYVCFDSSQVRAWEDVRFFSKKAATISWLAAKSAEKPYEGAEPPMIRTVFDPDKPFVDFAGGTLNRFIPPEETPDGTLPANLLEVLNHVLNYDKDMVEAFLDWMAFLYQRREAPHSAWLLSGCPGTGKDLVMNAFIATLGRGYSKHVSPIALAEKYTGWAEDTNLVFVNEADTRAFKGNTLSARMNDLITGDTVGVRRMGTDVYEVPNRLGFVFTSNRQDGYELTARDRRIHVPPRQEAPLLKVWSVEQCAKMAAFSEEEARSVRGFLRSRKFDEDRLRFPKLTKAKRTLAAASQPAAVRVFTRLRQGEWGPLLDDMPSYRDAIAQHDPYFAEDLNDLLRVVHSTASHKMDLLLKMKEVKTLAAALIDPKLWRMGPAKFKQYAMHNELPEVENVDRHRRVDGEQIRGTKFGDVCLTADEMYNRAVNLGYLTENPEGGVVVSIRS